MIVKLVLAAAASALVLLASGAAGPVLPEACGDFCFGETGEDEDCAPTCVWCSCCAAHRVFDPTPRGFALPLLQTGAVSPDPGLDLGAPHPREIVHVPKSA